MSARLTPEFLADFKARTEARWAVLDPLRRVHGFQFQRGTRWNPGLSAEELAACEKSAGLRFPDDLRLFLRAMNGTDRPTKHAIIDREQERPGVYSYPRDWENVRAIISDWRSWWSNVRKDLREQGIELPPSAFALPVYGHRGVVCSSDPADSRVLSITENDSIVYAPSLRDWLEIEFLRAP